MVPKRCLYSTLSIAVILLFQGLLYTPASSAQDRRRFLRWTYEDAGALVQDTNPRALLYAMGSAAVLASLSPLDPPFLEEVQEGYSGGLATYLDATNELGGPRAIVPVASLLVVSLATDNPRFQDAAFTSLQALAYSAAITAGFKIAIGRFRPEADAGAYRFAPFSGNRSLPSGHTSAAFAIVTPWVLYYPNVATYGLFALSVGTAVARIALDKHWPTDVLAGAAIGFLTARWLTRRHQGAEGGRLSLTPSAGPDALSLTLRLRLE